MVDKWGFSESEENWSSVEFCFDTKEEAVAAGNKEVSAGESFYVGRKNQPCASEFFPDADLIIEHMACQAGDAGGELAEDYPDVSKQQREALDAKLSACLSEWIKECGLEPTFFTIEELSSHISPEA